MSDYSDKPYKGIKAHQELATCLGIPDETLHGTIADKARKRIQELEAEIKAAVDLHEGETDIYADKLLAQQERIQKLSVENERYKTALKSITLKEGTVGALAEEDDK